MKRKKQSVAWYRMSPFELLVRGLQYLLHALSWVLSYIQSSISAAWTEVRESRKKPVALSIAIVIPLLVIGIHWVAVARMTASQLPFTREIIDELCSIRIPTGRPVPNHGDSKLLFLKYDNDDAWGLNLLDVDSGQVTRVHELKPENRGESETFAVTDMAILGWSPDDRYFAYAKNNRQEIVICDGQSGKQAFISAFVGGLDSSAWISPTKLLCSDGITIFQFESKSETDWEETMFYRAALNPEEAAAFDRGETLPVHIQSVCTLGDDAAAWQESNVIWTKSLSSDEAPSKIWESTNAALLDFSYSSEAGKFLLHCQDAEGEYLADFYPKLFWHQDRFTNVVRLDTGNYSPQHISLINDGKGYAYVDHNDYSMSRLIVKLTASSPAIELPWHDEVRGFFVNGMKLYAVTARANEPPGIWRYDLASGALDELLSSVKQPLQHASNAPVIRGCVTNAAGEQLTYYLLQPTRPTTNRKRPMVIGIVGIGEKGYTWDRFAQTIANCGGYYLCMDRLNRDSDSWAEDVFCAYDVLSKTLDMDTNRVYALGISVGTAAVGQMLQSRPDVFNGAILLSGSRFPYPDGLRVKFVFLDAGGASLGDAKIGLIRSQSALAAAGIRPILIVHPHAGHIVRTIALDRERMKRIAAYINQP